MACQHAVAIQQLIDETFRLAQLVTMNKFESKTVIGCIYYL